MINPTAFISEGSKAWNELKVQAQNWAKKVVEVYNTPVPQSLAKDKESLLSSAKIIKKTIESVFGNLTELNNVGLGAIFPLIPLAVIAGAAAAITKWTYDYNKFKASLAEYQNMVASGVPPKDAAATVKMISESAASQSSLANIAKIIPVLVIGLLGFTLLKRGE